MRRGWKIVGWVFTFSACFAVGAVIAAHSDPFPPGVTDPGATVAPTQSPSLALGPTLTGTLHLRSAHNLYVGGACRTNWQGTITVQQDAAGSVSGTGAFHLVGGLRCDFSVIQVQTKTVHVGVTGSVKGARVTWVLAGARSDPKASSDFGGLTHTVQLLRLAAPLGLADPLVIQQEVHASRSDGDRGTYTTTGTFTVSCTANCA